MDEDLKRTLSCVRLEMVNQKWSSQTKGLQSEGGFGATVWSKDNEDSMYLMTWGVDVAPGKWQPVMTCTSVPVEGREEAAGRQHEGALGQNGASIVDPLQVASCHVCHAYGPSWAVQKLVAIPAKVKNNVHECMLQ